MTGSLVQATCAICETAIVSRQKFVIVGHEVVHRSCATSGNKTRHQQLVQQLADQAVELARINRMIGRSAAELQRALMELGMGRTELRRECLAKEFLDGQLRDAEQQRREAMAECVRLRAELATARDAPQLRQDPERVVEPDEPEQDDTAERFRLLELD